MAPAFDLSRCVGLPEMVKPAFAGVPFGASAASVRKGGGLVRRAGQTGGGGDGANRPFEGTSAERLRDRYTGLLVVETVRMVDEVRDEMKALQIGLD